VGLAKGSDKETVPLRRSTTGKCYDKNNIRLYNNIIKRVSKEEGVLFINILNGLNDRDFYDGLHPNTGGQKKFFEIIKKSLIINKII